MRWPVSASAGAGTLSTPLCSSLVLVVKAPNGVFLSVTLLSLTPTAASSQAILQPNNLRAVSDAALPGALASLFGGEEQASALLGRTHTVRSQCCAQFVVSRESIWQHSQNEYIALRQWLLDGNVYETRQQGRPAPLDDRVAGRIYPTFGTSCSFSSKQSDTLMGLLLFGTASTWKSSTSLHVQLLKTAIAYSMVDASSEVVMGHRLAMASTRYLQTSSYLTTGLPLIREILNCDYHFPIYGTWIEDVRVQGRLDGKTEQQLLHSP